MGWKSREEARSLNSLIIQTDQIPLCLCFPMSETRNIEDTIAFKLFKHLFFLQH